MIRRHIPLLVAFILFLIPRHSPGTIAEQRARLPPPAECDDGVTGVWQSHVYTPRYRDWYVFTLYINRDKEQRGRLQGKITVHTWSGGQKDSEPPPCLNGAREYKLTMKAAGTFSGSQVTFGGLSYTLDEEICGRFSSYNLDQFSGTIDYKIQEFNSLNNDGGLAVNEPSVFRRIKCFEWEPDLESPPEKPPLFPQKKRRGGCL